MAPLPKATIFDKILLAPKIARVLFAALWRLITGPFSKATKQKELYKDVLFAALRRFVSIMSAPQEQWLNPTTESVYLNFAKQQKFQPRTDILESGLKVHWLGPNNADKIILYLHGGGYVLAASMGHFQWISDLQKGLAKTNSVSVVVPGYTLAPAGQYPVQLRQAAESLEWLRSTQKKKLSDIIVLGDSAGGNLCLALLSHLNHPHSEVAHKMHINVSEPLAGAVLISPWTKFATDDESVKRNAESDLLTPQAVKRWSSLFLGTAPLDNYNQPILANSNWFSGLDLRVKDILVWAGGAELLIDSIEATAKKLKEAHLRTEIMIEPGAAHDDFIIEKVMGYKRETEGSKAIESWIAQRL